MADFSITGTAWTWAQRTPDSPALTCGADTLTWRQLQDRVERVAGALEASGVRRGDRVAVLDKNGLPWVELLLAADHLGAVHVAISPRCDAEDVRDLVNGSGARVLVLAAELLPIHKEVEHELTAVTTTVVCGPGAGEHLSYDEWVDAAAPLPLPAAHPDDDVVLQLSTSGVTGRPRSVMLTHGSFSTLPERAARIGMGPTSVSLTAMPLSHIGGAGWALLGLAAGAHTVLLREVDGAALLRVIARERVTHAFLVPPALEAMTGVLGAEEFDLSSLSLVVYGATALSPALLREARALLRCDLAGAYGLTESAGAITLLEPADHDDPGLLRSVGRPMSGVELRCVDRRTGQDVPEGEIGEVWVRSTQVMAGYWQQPEATSQALLGDGWLHTGDAGSLRDGLLTLHDRVQDLVVTAGGAFYPSEVEAVLLAHPCVVEAAVVGLPRADGGQDVRAVLVVQPRARYDVEEVQRFCRLRLPEHLVPSSVVVVDALPRSTSGRVLKRVLRQPDWEARQAPIA